MGLSIVKDRHKGIVMNGSGGRGWDQLTARQWLACMESIS